MTLEKVQYTAKAHTTDDRDKGAFRNDWRRSLATSVAVAAFGLVLLAAHSYAQTVQAADARAFVNSPHPAKQSAAAEDDSIRPFHINVPEEELVDLHRRLAATRWPDRETVTDRSQGIQLATMKELVRYWQTDYDWRKAEAKLNALPEFVTTIDGVDIQFVHVRSRYPNAMPLIMTHGWPGSIFELVKVIGPLTDPPAYGGRAEDAFDLVLPSMPGYGFSGRPQVTGWNPDHIVRAWAELMRRLGYKRYVSQGGDWGAVISDALENPRSASAEQRLKELGIKLPAPPQPFGTYVEAVQTGNLLFLTGMLPTEGRGAKFTGRVGAELDVETGCKAAYLAALNVLAVVQQHLGSPDKVTRIVRLGVSVATSGDVRDQPKVADAASELLQDVFGQDKNPCRLVYGVASLPLGTPVELEVIFEVAG